jgi:hypothetical protein
LISISDAVAGVAWRRRRHAYCDVREGVLTATELSPADLSIEPPGRPRWWRRWWALAAAIVVAAVVVTTVLIGWFAIFIRLNTRVLS